MNASENNRHRKDPGSHQKTDKGQLHAKLNGTLALAEEKAHTGYFSVAMLNYPNRTNFRKEGITLAHR